MDPLSALGIACNVMQIISISHEFCIVARHVYDKGVVNEELVDQAAHLENLASSVEAALKKGGQPNTKAEKQIVQIAEKCCDAAKELQKTMTDLVSAAPKGNVAAAARTSIKALWRQNRIQKLEKNLLQWRQTLNSGLLLTLYSQSEARALEQSTSFAQLDNSLQNAVSQLALGNCNLTNMVVSESIAVKSHITSEISRAQSDTDNQIKAESKATQECFLNRLENLSLTTAFGARLKAILQSLKFESMNGRKNMISDTQFDTFQWIFSQEPHIWSSFPDWLRSTDKLYWISGKPGSGKSTLMKFIVHAGETAECLEPGTILLSHYLWIAGDPMQSSTKGLLLSLLHQLLLHDQVLLIAGLLDSAAFDHKESPSDWSLSELMSCFKAVLFKYCSSKKVCIFLDALDEVSSSEGPCDIIELVDELLRIPGVRFCISSRPEPAFKRRYETEPTLRLQDLTESDIKQVCRGLLRQLQSETIQDRDLAESNDENMSSLVHRLVVKAEGVFLWVQLAIRSIKRGYSNSDSWEHLQKRLEGLPGDLDELYKSMWKRANLDHGIYEQDAALYLNLMLQPEFNLPFTMSYEKTAIELLLASDDSIQDFVLGGKVGFTAEALEAHCRACIKTMEIRCAGFVEFFQENHTAGTHFKSISNKWDNLLPLTQICVRFIHRTASDFLVDTEGGQQILQMAKFTKTEYKLKIVKMSLARLTLWPVSLTGFKERIWQYSIGDVLLCIRDITPDVSDKEIDGFHLSLEKIWAQACLIITLESPEIKLTDFLGLLANAGLASSVRARIAEIEVKKRLELNPKYLDYLLYQASVAVSILTEPPVSKGGLELVQWLWYKGACLSTKFYDIRPYTSLSHHTTSLLTPFQKLLLSIVENVYSEDEWYKSADTVFSLHFRQAVELISQVLKEHPTTYLEQKSIVQLSSYPGPDKAAGWDLCSYLDFDMGVRLRRCNAFIEVNVALLLEYVQEGLKVQASRLKDGPYFDFMNAIQWAGDTTIQPLARLISFKDYNWAQYSCIPQSQGFLDPGLFLNIILASQRPGVSSVVREELRSNLVQLILDVLDIEADEITTGDGLSEHFKDCSIIRWPPPPGSDVSYPPPMFD